MAHQQNFKTGQFQSQIVRCQHSVLFVAAKDDSRKNDACSICRSSDIDPRAAKKYRKVNAKAEPEIEEEDEDTDVESVNEDPNDESFEEGD